MPATQLLPMPRRQPSAAARTADKHLASASEFLALATKQEEDASSEELRADRVNTVDLQRRVAIALSKSEHKIEDMIIKWDKNGKGSITKLEFRMGVRAPTSSHGVGVAEAELREIDAVFDVLARMSAKVSGPPGTLSCTDLKGTLKKLVINADTYAAEEDEVRAHAWRLREQATRTRQVAEAFEEAEEAEAQLERRRSEQSVEAQLGLLLVKKNYKVADMLDKWDLNRDRRIQKSEFRTKVQELGVNAEVKDIDALFNVFDNDENHSLDMDELKLALTKLRAAAKTAADEIDSLERLGVSLRRAATKQQASLEAWAKESDVEARDVETARRTIGNPNTASLGRAEGKRNGGKVTQATQKTGVVHDIADHKPARRNSLRGSFAIAGKRAGEKIEKVFSDGLRSSMRRSQRLEQALSQAALAFRAVTPPRTAARSTPKARIPPQSTRAATTGRGRS